jgi:hypothetical protein
MDNIRNESCLAQTGLRIMLEEHDSEGCKFVFTREGRKWYNVLLMVSFLARHSTLKGDAVLSKELPGLFPTARPYNIEDRTARSHR